MGLVITEILLQGDTSESRGNIEIDISSMESSSEVRVVMCSRMFVLVLQKRSIRRFVITEKAPTRAFSWLKAATTAFTFKTLLRHYAKQMLTPRSLNVKLGP